MALDFCITVCENAALDATLALHQKTNATLLVWAS